MKVIDILNKIANNEELPLRIRVNGYEYRICNGQYFSDEKYMYLVDSSNSISHLNDEVLVIEEDKKIEKIEQRTDTGLIGTDSVDMIEHTNRINRQAGYLSEIVSKINEIIDKLNAGVDKE